MTDKGKKPLRSVSPLQKRVYNDPEKKLIKISQNK